jgi:hypothetical protein
MIDFDARPTVTIPSINIFLFIIRLCIIGYWKGFNLIFNSLI